MFIVCKKETILHFFDHFGSWLVDTGTFYVAGCGEMYHHAADTSGSALVLVLIHKQH